MWPHELARILGTFIVQARTAEIHIRIVANLVDSFYSAGKQVHTSTCCAHVVFVSKWPLLSHSERTHAIIATRWTRDRSLICTNSHGIDIPFPRVTEIDFINAVWLGVIVERYMVPLAQGARPEETVVRVDPEWDFIAP